MGKPRAPSMLEDLAHVVAQACARRPVITCVWTSLGGIALVATNGGSLVLYGALALAGAAAFLTSRGLGRRIYAPASPLVLLLVILVGDTVLLIAAGAGRGSTSPWKAPLAVFVTAIVATLAAWALLRRSRGGLRRTMAGIALFFVLAVPVTVIDWIGRLTGTETLIGRDGVGGMLLPGCLLAAGMGAAAVLPARIAWGLSLFLAAGLGYAGDEFVEHGLSLALLGLAAVAVGRVCAAWLLPGKPEAALRLVVRLQAAPFRIGFALSLLASLVYLGLAPAITLLDQPMGSDRARIAEFGLSAGLRALVMTVWVFSVFALPAVLGVAASAAAPPGTNLMSRGRALIAFALGMATVVASIILAGGTSPQRPEFLGVFLATVGGVVFAWAVGATPGLVRGGRVVDAVLAAAAAALAGWLIPGQIDVATLGGAMLCVAVLLHRLARAPRVGAISVWGAAIGGLALGLTLRYTSLPPDSNVAPAWFMAVAIACASAPLVPIVRALRFAHSARAIPPDHAVYSDFGRTVKDALIASSEAERVDVSGGSSPTA